MKREYRIKEIEGKFYPQYTYRLIPFWWNFKNNKAPLFVCYDEKDGAKRFILEDKGKRQNESGITYL